MKQKIQYLFSQQKRITYTLLWVFFLLLCHTVLFFGHQFLVERYDVLHAEATGEGTLIIMPEEFQRLHTVAARRSFLTRTDILAREALTLQSGVRSLMSQYRNDFYRMQEMIAGNITAIQGVIEEGTILAFPEREEVIYRANELEAKLNLNKDTRVESLEELAEMSKQYLLKAKNDLERTKKALVLQDITSLQHEITFLDSLYLVSPSATLKFDTKVFNKLYMESFSAEQLTKSADELRVSWSTISNLMDPYRIESRDIRARDREKRAEMVTEEAKKWVELDPPKAPFSDIYTQIYITLSDQMMYVYEDNELILSTLITSGRSGFTTIRGTFKVYYKKRNKILKSPFPDQEYELWVDYWIAFHGAYGIHDACNSRDCWRTVYGTKSYIYNGSHGCINTPYKAVAFIYDWSRIGTTVHVK